MSGKFTVRACVGLASVIGLVALCSLGGERTPENPSRPAPPVAREIAPSSPERRARPDVPRTLVAPGNLEARLQAAISAHQDWSEAELSHAVAELDGELRAGEWLERANTARLSEPERQQLAELLTRRDALNLLRAERLLAKLDVADDQSASAR